MTHKRNIFIVCTPELETSLWAKVNGPHRDSPKATAPTSEPAVNVSVSEIVHESAERQTMSLTFEASFEATVEFSFDLEDGLVLDEAIEGAEAEATFIADVVDVGSGDNGDFR